MTQVVIINAHRYQRSTYGYFRTFCSDRAHDIRMMSPAEDKRTPFEGIYETLRGHLHYTQAYMPSENMLIVADLQQQVYTDYSVQPRGLTGSGAKDGRAIMELLVKATKGLDLPVDVLIATRFRPDFIHDYAQDLPRGSVVASLKNRSGHTLLENMHFFPDAGLRVRDFLCELMAQDAADEYSYLPGRDLTLWPEIAVSGAPRHHLHDMTASFMRKWAVDEVPAEVCRKVNEHLGYFFDPGDDLKLTPSGSGNPHQSATIILRKAAMALIGEWHLRYGHVFPPALGQYDLPAPKAKRSKPVVNTAITTKPALVHQTPQQSFAPVAEQGMYRSTSLLTTQIMHSYKPGVPLLKQPAVLRVLSHRKIGPSNT